MMLKTAVFCLVSGGMFGLLYVLFALLRALLGAGKWLTALLDVVFFGICGAAAFTIALAVDAGRLRSVQLVPQLVGAWAVIVLLTPAVERAARLLHRAKEKLCARFFRVFRAISVKITPHEKTTEISRKKT